MGEWNLATVIGERLQQTGETQAQLAERLGATQGAVSRWLSGERLVDLRYLNALAEWLQKPYADVQGWWMVEQAARSEKKRSTDRIAQLEQQVAALTRAVDELQADRGDDAPNRHTSQPRSRGHRATPPGVATSWHSNLTDQTNPVTHCGSTGLPTLLQTCTRHPFGLVTHPVAPPSSR